METIELTTESKTRKLIENNVRKNLLSLLIIIFIVHPSLFHWTLKTNDDENSVVYCTFLTTRQTLQSHVMTFASNDAAVFPPRLSSLCLLDVSLPNPLCPFVYICVHM